MPHEVDVVWEMDSFFLTRGAADALFSLTESTPLKVIWSCLQRAETASHYLRAVKSRSRESLCVRRHTEGGWRRRRWRGAAESEPQCLVNKWRNSPFPHITPSLPPPLHPPSACAGEALRRSQMKEGTGSFYFIFLKTQTLSCLLALGKNLEGSNQRKKHLQRNRTALVSGQSQEVLPAGFLHPPFLSASISVDIDEWQGLQDRLLLILIAE